MLMIGYFILGGTVVYATKKATLDRARPKLMPYLLEARPELMLYLLEGRKARKFLAPKKPLLARIDVWLPQKILTQPEMENAPLTIVRQVGIIGLTGATMLIHIYLALTNGLLIFWLNALGYATLLIALYAIPPLKPYRNYIRQLLIVYTSITIIGYFVLRWSVAWTNLFGLLSKFIEICLIALLYLEHKALNPSLLFRLKVQGTDNR